MAVTSTRRGASFFEGRLSDIIKSGGANVSLLEVDDAIRAFSGVKLVQTIGLPHATLGEEVVACIVTHEGAEVSEQALRDFLQPRLASFKIPRRIFFPAEEEVSMTGSNKVKAGPLRDLVAKMLSEETKQGESNG